MTHDQNTQISGRIGDVFAHRFVIETSTGTILADLGPKGQEAFPLETGLSIIASGEMKPSELKVKRIAIDGRPAVIIEHAKKPDHADPSSAAKAVRAAGFEPVGEPRRKPKHFEVLARKDGHLIECHIELDGRIRKEKPIEANDEKWSAEITKAA